MEYLYAALLLHKAGKEINEENMTAVLNAAGVDVDTNRVKSLVAALKGVNIDEALASAAMVAAAPSGGGATTETVAEEEKPKEEEEEEVDEADLGLGSLFG